MQHTVCIMLFMLSGGTHHTFRYRLAYQPTHLFTWLWIKGMLSLTRSSTEIFCDSVLINVTV